MENRRITIEKLEVHNNGDPGKKGELYWKITANNQGISERTRNNPVKVRNGDEVTLGEDLTIDTLQGNDRLTVSGIVKERERAGGDEKDAFHHVYSHVDNWGEGSHQAKINDGRLDVTVHYRIEDI